MHDRMNTIMPINKMHTTIDMYTRVSAFMCLRVYVCLYIYSSK